MSGLNLYGYSTTQSGQLIADFGGGTNAIPGNSADSKPSWTLQADTGGIKYPIASALELQSVYGGFVVPRMTTVQRDAMGDVNTISTNKTLTANGTIIYNTTDEEFNLFESDGWLAIPGGAGNVDFVGAAPLDNELVRFSGITGLLIQAETGIIISDTSAISGVLTISVGDGSAAVPSYTFSGDANTGMWSSGVETIDFSTGGTRQLQIANTPVAVNYLTISGSATGTALLLGASGTDGNIDIEVIPKGTGALVNAVGAIATPSFTFVGRTDTGMWSSGANLIDFSTATGRQFQITETGIAAVNYLAVGGSDTGESVSFIAEGTDINIDIEFVPKGTGALVNAIGQEDLPSYTFSGRGDTGIWSSADDVIDFSTGAERQFQITDMVNTVNWISAKGGATVSAGAGPGQPVFTANGTDALVDVAVVGKGAATGLSILPNTGAGAGQIKLWNGAGTFWSTIKSAAVAANKTWTLPLADATIPGQAIVSDAAGTLSFESVQRTQMGTFSTADIIGMYAAPVQILPAAPAGYAYIIKDFYLEIVFTTAAPAAGGAIDIQYGATIQGGGTNAINSGTQTIAAVFFTGAAANQFQWLVSENPMVTTPITNYQAAAIYISNDTAAFTANGGTSTARYSISYVIVPMD